MGSAYGQTSPVKFPGMRSMQAVLSPGAILPLDPDYDERAIYIVSGKVDIAGDAFGAGQLLIFKPGDPHLDPRHRPEPADDRRRRTDGRARHVWWNFVSSSRRSIDQAKAEWKAGRFDLRVPGDEAEFIPLPEG